jgi:hypothetical protein
MRRVIFLPVLLLGAPLYRHFHPTHTWLEGKVRDQVNQELAPVTAKDVSCDVQGDLATCHVTTSDGHVYTITVTRNGDTWTPTRAVRDS